MKFSKRKSGMKLTDEKNASISTDEAVRGVPSTAKDGSKAKKKKFGLFKSKSKKSAESTPPQTPDTVKDTDGDASNLSIDHEVTVIPVGQASVPRKTPPKTEEELKETLTWARSLLAELDMADAETGTELILPGTRYEEVETSVEEQAVTTDMETENTDVVDQNKEEAAEVEKQEPADVEDETKTNENRAEVAEEKKEEDEVDARNSSMEVEKLDGTSDQQKEDPPQNVAQSAVKMLTAAFSCTSPNTEKCGESFHTALYENSLVSRFTTVDLNNMYDEKSGSEFLHGLTNVGYTLIYHISVDEDSWVGRTINLVFRPGVCSSEKIVDPVIEWNTMVGGKSNFIETKTMRLLNIDAIATSIAHEGGDNQSPIKPSALPIPAKPPTNPKNDASISMCSLNFPPVNGVEDEFDCFFTITSQDGEIHLFEALNTEDCHHIVAGIRYSAQRLSHVLIEGDATSLLSDFYDNAREPEESKLPQSEVINKLSNAFLDGL